jgi:hypothetical protein
MTAETQSEMIEAILTEKHKIEIEYEKKLSHLRTSLIRIQSEIPDDAGIRHFENEGIFTQMDKPVNDFFKYLGDILNPANCKI